MKGVLYIKIFKNMRHLQTTAIPGRNSKGIARRRKRNIRKLISPRTFQTLHSGRISLRTYGKIVLCRFYSHEKNVHAWGPTPAKSYRNMLRNFHLKFTS